MEINFITPTRISILDITSMGDSVKRNDVNTIGQFDSGLKYAIALLLRHNVDISIHVQGEPIIHDTWEEDTTESYRFTTFVNECSNTGKQKELIRVACTRTPHGGLPTNHYDMREPSSPQYWSIDTGFAKNLGYNWELWMALRELYSNMVDEGGSISESPNYVGEDVVEGTIITLSFDEDNEFTEVWNNKHLYINESAVLYNVNNGIEVLTNEEEYLRIYKRNILVHEDKDIPSRFAWNISFGEIDERRLLRNVYEIEQTIANGICTTTNEEFLRAIITPDFEVKENEFLSEAGSYYSVSNLINDVVSRVNEEHGEVSSYRWLIDKVKSRKDCTLTGRKIKTVEDSLWSYSKTVTVESTPVAVEVNEISTTPSIQDSITKLYNFKIGVEIKTAKLKGSKVVADKFAKCLIVDEEFNVETDFIDFIVEYTDLTQTGNIITNLAKQICNLIKK